MRTEKELWELVLNNKGLFYTGLCGWVRDVYYAGWIESHEEWALKASLRRNLPPKVFDGSFCWPIFSIEPRIDWINERIKQLEE